MASYNIELNNNPIKGSNEHSLFLRITVNRKHARIKLNYAVIPRQFNPSPKQNKYIRASHPKHIKINNYLGDQIQAAKDVENELIKESKVLSADLIKKRLNKASFTNFDQFLTSYIEIMEMNNQIGNMKKHKTLKQRLTEFRNNKEITFEEIDISFLEEFQMYLRKLGNNQTTISKYLRALRSTYNKAIESGKFDGQANPFNSFKIKTGQPNKDRLTIEEIIKIEKMALRPGTLISHVRNVFLFSFYNAGIRISDLLTLKWGNIHNGRLAYTMYKTNRNHSLLLKDKPLAILNQYRTDDIQKDDYIFPFFKSTIDYSEPLFLHNQIGSKTALINKYLKQIATKAEIDKNVTTHTARHSFADIARKKEKNIYNLSKALGHSSIKVTESYLATFDEAAVDETLNNVFD
jgi:integrase